MIRFDAIVSQQAEASLVRGGRKERFVYRIAQMEAKSFQRPGFSVMKNIFDRRS
jgi:hypothetical protein